jgi:hypothetical protein
MLLMLLTLNPHADRLDVWCGKYYTCPIGRWKISLCAFIIQDISYHIYNSYYGLYMRDRTFLFSQVKVAFCILETCYYRFNILLCRDQSYFNSLSTNLGINMPVVNLWNRVAYFFVCCTVIKYKSASEVLDLTLYYNVLKCQVFQWKDSESPWPLNRTGLSFNATSGHEKFTAVFS